MGYPFSSSFAVLTIPSLIFFSHTARVKYIQECCHLKQVYRYLSTYVPCDVVRRTDGSQYIWRRVKGRFIEPTCA
jgi:hypothetical protein